MKSTCGWEYTKGKGYPTLSVGGIPVVIIATTVPITMIRTTTIAIDVLIILTMTMPVTMIIDKTFILTMLMLLDNADDKTYVSNDGN